MKSGLAKATGKLGAKGQDSITQHFQVSFYGDFINEFGSSSELTQRWQTSSTDIDDLTWEEGGLPPIYTPINNLEILKH